MKLATMRLGFAYVGIPLWVPGFIPVTFMEMKWCLLWNRDGTIYMCVQIAAELFGNNLSKSLV